MEACRDQSLKSAPSKHSNEMVKETLKNITLNFFYTYVSVYVEVMGRIKEIATKGESLK